MVTGISIDDHLWEQASAHDKLFGLIYELVLVL